MISGRVRAGSTGFILGPGWVPDWVWTPKMAKKGPKSEEKKEGEMAKNGKFWVRATAKTPGPVRAGMDHRPLLSRDMCACKGSHQIRIDGNIPSNPRTPPPS